MSKPDYENDPAHSTDWLEALQSDAAEIDQVLKRVESLGILAIEHVKRGDLKAAIVKMGQMGEGIQLVRQLMGLK